MSALREKNNLKNGAGFTLIEVVTGITIIILLSLLSGPAFRLFQGQSYLMNTAEEVMTILREAQSKAKASEGNMPWGVYIDIATTPDRYVLFQGVSYATRNASQDKVFNIPSGVEFSAISLGVGNEAVFQKVTGSPVPSGSVSLWLASDHSKTRTVSLNASGVLMVGTFPAASDTNRIKDSRHVHVDYVGRTIDTSSESVRLVFPGITQTIPIVTNLPGGAFSWEGEVISQGQVQNIRIHTHRLNDLVLGTQFSVHRDQRYNTKAVIVELSGDSTGNLLQYDAAGQTTQGTSVYAATPSWQ